MIEIKSKHRTKMPTEYDYDRECDEIDYYFQKRLKSVYPEEFKNFEEHDNLYESEKRGIF